MVASCPPNALIKLQPTQQRAKRFKKKKMSCQFGGFFRPKLSSPQTLFTTANNFHLKGGATETRWAAMESIHVAIRIRPMSENEEATSSCAVCVPTSQPTVVVQVGADWKLLFFHVESQDLGDQNRSFPTKLGASIIESTCLENNVDSTIFLARPLASQFLRHRMDKSSSSVCRFRWL